MGQVTKNIGVGDEATVTPAEFGFPSGSLGNPTGETDNTVANVSGLVPGELEATGLTGGTTVITIPVTSADGTNTQECDFTVIVSAVAAGCQPYTITVEMGDTATIDPALARDPLLQPSDTSSADTSIATVSGFEITPVAVGTTTVNLQFSANGQPVDACPITVVVEPDSSGATCTPVTRTIDSTSADPTTAVTPADLGFPGGVFGNPTGETGNQFAQVTGLVDDEVIVTGTSAGQNVITMPITLTDGSVEECDITVNVTGDGNGCVNQDGFVLVGGSGTVTPDDLGYAGMEFNRFTVQQTNSSATSESVATTAITVTGVAVGVNTYTVEIVEPGTTTVVATCMFEVEVREDTTNDPCSGIPGSVTVDCGATAVVTMVLPTGATAPTVGVIGGSANGSTSGLTNTTGTTWRFNYTAPACDGNEPKTLLVSVDFNLADGSAAPCDNINMQVRPVTQIEGCALSDGTNTATVDNPKVTVTGGGPKDLINRSDVDATLTQASGTATLVPSTGVVIAPGRSFGVNIPNDGSQYRFALKCGEGC